MKVKTYKYKNGTTYFITEVGRSFISRGLAGDNLKTGKLEKTTSFSNRHKLPLTLNASTFDMNERKLRAIVIHQGKVVQDEPNKTGRTYLVIYKDGQVGYLDHDTSSKEMIRLGVQESLLGFFPIVLDGKRVKNTFYKPYPFSLNALNPQQVLYRANGELFFLTVNGRLANEPGLSVNQMMELLIEKGADFAYLLDGGGSTSTVVDGKMINKLPTAEREVADFIYIERDDAKLNESVKSSDLNKEVERLKKQVEVQRVDDIEKIKKTGSYWLARTAKGLPKNDNFSMIYTALSDEVGILVAYPFDDSDGTVYKNTRRSGKFRGWCKNE